MKLTDLGLLFLIVFVPIFVIAAIHLSDEREVQWLEEKYTSALQTAVQDAGAALSRNERLEEEAGYGSSKKVRANKEMALDIFTKSLAMNMGIDENPALLRQLYDYIPALVVVDYEGCYILSQEEWTSSDGTKRKKPVWSALKPYVYQDAQGNMIHFTLDDEFEAYDAAAGRWLKGKQAEAGRATSIPLLQNTSLYHQVRRSTIVNRIQQDLATVIQSHPTVGRNGAQNYQFMLPTIPDEEWYNSIEDVGILVFLQGIPVGNRYYNNFAMGGGRLVRKETIWAGADPASGIRYYASDSCARPFPAEEAFVSRSEAASHGYFEWRCDSDG
ncbi:hypothetical protein Q5741_00650 [Paenibacillus sp. JX-17]|uniref:F0F1-type ATP synthase n=1 Tax=Paenibacillus lacisoli TaxID=3064525 RepID=A0ABT9CA68_9BACL|nr:hypothetical protein [Paenibacillus sp. JX-17]MDO7904917.1 hypothetical protein [Paenibacillus sp. JX-17]